MEKTVAIRMDSKRTETGCNGSIEINDIMFQYDLSVNLPDLLINIDNAISLRNKAKNILQITVWKNSNELELADEECLFFYKLVLGHLNTFVRKECLLHTGNMLNLFNLTSQISEIDEITEKKNYPIANRTRQMLSAPKFGCSF